MVSDMLLFPSVVKFCFHISPVLDSVVDYVNANPSTRMPCVMRRMCAH